MFKRQEKGGGKQVYGPCHSNLTWMDKKRWSERKGWSCEWTSFSYIVGRQFLKLIWSGCYDYKELSVPGTVFISVLHVSPSVQACCCWTLSSSRRFQGPNLTCFPQSYHTRYMFPFILWMTQFSESVSDSVDVTSKCGGVWSTQHRSQRMWNVSLIS